MLTVGWKTLEPSLTVQVNCVTEHDMTNETAYRTRHASRTCEICSTTLSLIQLGIPGRVFQGCNYWQRLRKLWKSGSVDERRGWKEGKREGERQTEWICYFPVMEVRGTWLSFAAKNFWKYRCKSMQHDAFWSKTHILSNSVFNLDFGRSVWWHQVIKSGT